MDAISQAIATILFLATSNEHSATVNHFIQDTLEILVAGKESSNKAISDTMAAGLNNNITNSSEVWGEEEKPVLVKGWTLNPTVPVPVAPLSKPESYPSVIGGPGPGMDEHQLLQRGKVPPQVSQEGAVLRLKRFGRLWDMFPWKRK